jgi:hypothetical protein
MSDATINTNVNINKYTSYHIFIQYIAVMNEYLTHFSQSTKYIKNDKDNRYLLLNGLSTLNHVFMTFLHMTLNPVLALENMQKSIYYYTQFIDQIEENVLNDLNISSMSASIFVYNKTIAELSSSDKDNNNATLFLSNCVKMSEFYRNMVDLLICKSNNVNINDITVKMTDIGKECYRDTVNDIEKDLKRVLTNVTILLQSEENRCNIYEFILTYLKHYKHINLSIESLYKKKTQTEYHYKVNKNYIKWLIT